MKHFSSIEALEARIAPSVLTLSLSAAGKLTVTGADGSVPNFNISSTTVGAGADAVTTYYLQGLSAIDQTTFALGKISAGITLGTSSVANDFATVVAKSIAIIFGDGVNSVSLGNGAQGLSVAGDLSITGGDFDDSIVVGANAFGVTVGKAFTVKLGKGNDKLVFAGTGTSSFGKTTLDFGATTDQLSPSNELATNGASSLTFTDSLTVTGGAQADRFVLGHGGGTVSVARNLTMNTGTGSDSVSILGLDISVGGNIAVTTKASPIPFNPTTVEISGANLFTVDGGITIKGSGSGNTDTIGGGSLRIIKGVTITGGAGDDTVAINAGYGYIGKVSVVGGNGTNHTTISNPTASGISVTGTDGDDTVVIDGGLVTGLASVSLGKGNSDVKLQNANFGSLTVKAAGVALATDKLALKNLTINKAASITHGAGDSTVDIDKLTENSTFTLKVGDGTNAINIAAIVGSGLSSFAGKTAITGGKGNDTVVIGRTQAVDAASFTSKLTLALGKGPDTDLVNTTTDDLLAIAALQLVNSFAIGIPPVVTGVKV